MWSGLLPRAGDYEGGSSSGSGSSNSGKELPYAKSLAQLQEQSVAPATHFVYALTWYDLITCASCG
jgi:hypothetical protein